jgi:magnesium transporter
MTTAKNKTASEKTAGHLARPPLVAAPEETAAQVRRRLQQGAHHLPAGGSPWSLLCVVDGQRRLLGTLSAVELLALPDGARVGDAAHRHAPHVAAHTDQEHMASIALDREVAALPVLDDEGRVLGVVGPRTLMAVLRREHVADLHQLAGIARESRQARQAIEDPPLRRARHRLPWLLVGLAGSVLATAVMSRFEAMFAALPAIAFFVPGLVYLADAIGTQSEAVAVRGLSLSHAGLARLLGGEMRTGLVLGLVLGGLALALTWVAFGQPRLAWAVALALAAACTLAALLGLLLPWLIGRIGLDPAYGSGPLATIIQDVLTLLIYFGTVGALLR